MSKQLLGVSYHAVKIESQYFYHINSQAVTAIFHKHYCSKHKEVLKISIGWQRIGDFTDCDCGT